MKTFELDWEYGFNGIEPHWGTAKIKAKDEDAAFNKFMDKFPQVEIVKEIRLLKNK